MDSRSTCCRTHGEITLDAPAVVGEGITGTIRLTAKTSFAARKAVLRLVGLRLVEQRESRENRDGQGHVTSTQRWVEAQGKLFIEDAFLEPFIPASFEAGQAWEGKFAVPAPQLGPPSAHLGEAIVAWALEVRWDVPHAGDHHLAIFLPLAQNPDLLRAGVGKQGGQSLAESVTSGDAQISVKSPLPASAGSEVVVSIVWPSANGGQKGRVELHRRTNAPNGAEGIVASIAMDPAAFQDGSAEARLLVPEGSAPSFDGAGLEITYIVRALVDRRFRGDLAIERPVGVV